MKKLTIIIVISIFNEWGFAQCDSAYTYFSELPDNVTILVGDSCFYNDDIAVLDSMVSQNNLDYASSLELGTQTWFNGRLRFLVAGNYKYHGTSLCQRAQTNRSCYEEQNNIINT